MMQERYIYIYNERGAINFDDTNKSTHKKVTSNLSSPILFLSSSTILLVLHHLNQRDAGVYERWYITASLTIIQQKEGRGGCGQVTGFSPTQLPMVRVYTTNLRVAGRSSPWCDSPWPVTIAGLFSSV